MTIDSAYLSPDAHDLMTRDAKIVTLQEELKQTLQHLEWCVIALEFYRKQHNGMVAHQTLSRLAGGH